MPANEPLRPDAERLLEDLAAQAGLALHNVRLTEELAIRARELAVQAEGLRVSRERLVTARDAQRRGLERDIREGPERQLREIRDELDSVAVDDPDAEDRLDALTAARTTPSRVCATSPAGSSRRSWPTRASSPHSRRTSARWARTRRSTRPPRSRRERFDADVEACLYFCALQAIQNVMRHAGNTACIVELEADARGDPLLALGPRSRVRPGDDAARHGDWTSCRTGSTRSRAPSSSRAPPAPAPRSPARSRSKQQGASRHDISREAGALRRGDRRGGRRRVGDPPRSRSARGPTHRRTW